MNAPEAVGAPAGAMLVAEAPLGQFAPSLTNRIHKQSHLESLAATIRPPGRVYQPITARAWPASRGPAPDSVLYEIIIGEGRWRASSLAERETVPFFWVEANDREALQMQLIENLKRQDLNALEEAEGYRRLMKEHGLAAEEVAKEIGLEGMSRSYVYARLKLLELGPEGREALANGLIKDSTALLIARLPAALQKRAAAEVLNGFDKQPMSVRAAKTHLQQHFTLSLKTATFKLDDAALVPSAGSCEACPKRAGNAPDLADELEADVCTDTKCFADKRGARHLQLLAIAEKKKIPVITGEEAREIVPYGSIDNYTCPPDNTVFLDDKIYDDAEGRTYRQVLGDKAPVTAYVEVGNSARDKQLVEMCDETTLEAALKKAGWKPAEAPPAAETKTKETAEQKAKREEREREQAQLREAKKLETERRGYLKDGLWPKLLAIDEDRLPELMPALLTAVLWRQVDYGFDRELLGRYGYTLPKSYEDDAEEAEKIAVAMKSWPVGKMLAYVFDDLVRDEMCGPDYLWKPGDGAKVLDSLAACFGASTPSKAAQAQGDGGAKPAAPAKAKKTTAKKPEAKSDPAAATPPNEPAAPAKTSGALNPVQAWPFPTGAH